MPALGRGAQPPGTLPIARPWALVANQSASLSARAERSGEKSSATKLNSVLSHERSGSSLAIAQPELKRCRSEALPELELELERTVRHIVMELAIGWLAAPTRIAIAHDEAMRC